MRGCSPLSTRSLLPVAKSHSTVCPLPPVANVFRPAKSPLRAEPLPMSNCLQQLHVLRLPDSHDAGVIRSDQRDAVRSKSDRRSTRSFLKTVGRPPSDPDADSPDLEIGTFGVPLKA